jgi:ribosome-associated protein
MLEVTPAIRIADEELNFSFVRSSGPGGQNVNKLNTKAVLRWSVLSPALPEDVRHRFTARFATRINDHHELLLTSQRYRDQKQNLRDCLEKLSAMLRAVATAPKRRKKTRPTKASKERRHTAKRAHSLKKQTRRASIERE